jgi:hypothetical protein
LLQHLQTERGQRRLRITRAAKAIGVAAALLLTIGAWVLMPPSQTRVDIGRTQGFVASNTANPSPDLIEQWFRQTHGVQMVAPPVLGENQLDYGLLIDYELAALPDGRQVPMLLFVRGKQQLRLYVLANRQFTTVNDTPDPSEGWTSEVFAPKNGKFTFVVLYQGDSLKNFCLRTAGPAA